MVSKNCGGNKFMKKSCVNCIHVGHNMLGNRRCYFPLPAWLNSKQSPYLVSDENYKDPENNWRNDLMSVSRAEECSHFEIKIDLVAQAKYETELQELRDKEDAHNTKFHPQWVATKQYSIMKEKIGIGLPTCGRPRVYPREKGLDKRPAGK